MILILSPAKTLDMETVHHGELTTPKFLEYSHTLIDLLRQKSVSEIRTLMGLSHKLADLNHQRYQNWDPTRAEQTRPAIHCFKGDVYQGLQADQFNAQQIQFAQSQLRILSGLYGLLKPLDAVSAHRLEMGTSLLNPKGINLYDFWRDTLTLNIGEELAQQSHPMLLNLASKEYAKAIDFKQLGVPIITPVFKDEKNGTYKIISFYAKKARGMMAAFIIKNAITTAEKLTHFDAAGYQFIDGIKKNNNETELLFHRKA